jgi:hypothetical protein
MSKRALVCIVLYMSLTCMTALGQQIFNNCPYAQQHWNQLACLIPDLTKTGGTSAGAFSTALGEVVAQLPLAAPTTGFGLTLDKTLGIYTVPNETLGSILSERGDTVGKYHLFVGFAYQKFNFQTIDGTQLNNLPVGYCINTSGSFPNCGNPGFTQSSLSANVNQYTAIAAFGLTSRIDISVTVPFERVSLGAGHGLVYSGGSVETQTPGTTSCPSSSTPTNTNPYCNQYVPGSASGIGDVVVEGKGSLWKGEHIRLAAGFDVRFPTGNEYNLLGSGAYGYKPFLTLSWRSRGITPHVNAGYQYNTRSVLYQSGGINQLLPRWFEYSAGADVRIVKRLTVVGDLLGQHFFDAPRITPASPANYQIQPPSGNAVYVNSIGVQNGAYDSDNLAIGLKANIWRSLILSENVLVKLNEGGLRSKVTPLAGLSYRF